jgi:hypothetical protein
MRNVGFQNNVIRNLASSSVNILELLKDRRDYMSQGVTPCTILQHVSEIHVTAFMWSKFTWKKRKKFSHLQDHVLEEKICKISRTYKDHIC